MKNGRRIIDSQGTKIWCLTGVYHRTDGPAVEIVDGYKAWYINGQRHRTDGPAVEHPNGTKEWYLNGEWYGSGEIPPVDYTLAALAYEGMSE